MEYKNRLYMVLYPNQSLIASQYDPEMFARHYTSGIENILKDLKPHSDGRPKATKFIASYRVLEHVELSALGKLYLSTEEGHCIGIEKVCRNCSYAYACNVQINTTGVWKENNRSF